VAPRGTGRSAVVPGVTHRPARHPPAHGRQPPPRLSPRPESPQRGLGESPGAAGDEGSSPCRGARRSLSRHPPVLVRRRSPLVLWGTRQPAGAGPHMSCPLGRSRLSAGARTQLDTEKNNTEKRRTRTRRNRSLSRHPPVLVRCMPVCKRRLPHVMSPQPESPPRGRGDSTG